MIRSRPVARHGLSLAIGAALAAGCVTETPGQDTTERDARQADVRRWIGELTLEGVREENHAARTAFLVENLVRWLPLGLPILLAEGVPHANPKVRENVAFCLGHAGGDRSAEEALVRLLDDPEELVSVSAAASLAAGHQSGAGVPVLLRALRHSAGHVRAEAEKSLRAFSHQYHGFEADAAPDAREFSARKWDAWWRAQGR